MMKTPVWFLYCLMLPLPAFAQDRSPPYSGQQGREIKALSQDEVKGYMIGQGMGLAKAAELNGYPGPLHVLELAAQLQLSEAQKRRAEEIRGTMLSKATSLGKAIVEKETELDTLFATGKINETKLRALAADIARLQGALRIAHLRAHLMLKPILTPAQVKRYSELRGYDGKAAGGQHEGSQHNVR